MIRFGGYANVYTTKSESNNNNNDHNDDDGRVEPRTYMLAAATAFIQRVRMYYLLNLKHPQLNGQEHPLKTGGLSICH